MVVNISITMKLVVMILLIVGCISTSCSNDSDCETLNECFDAVCTHKDLLPIAGTGELEQFY